MTTAATNVNWAGAAGNATLSYLGRWIGRGLVWAFRHPLSAGMGLTLSLGIGFGAVNAMYMQDAPHPAPLFMDTASIAQPAVRDLSAPIDQPFPSPLPPPVERVTSPVVAAPQPEPAPVTIPDSVGNKDVAELQARLKSLGFFAGAIDGWYGPQTADAIRRFETEAGLTPVGAVSPDVLAAARAYVPPSVPEPSALLPRVEVPVASHTAPAPNLAVSPAPNSNDDLIGRIASGLGEVEKVATAPAAESAPARPPELDTELVSMVQTGLSRLGFLHGEISGKLDAETARAIREFENYNNFRVTGELTPDLVDVLMAEGAFN